MSIEFLEENSAKFAPPSQAIIKNPEPESRLVTQIIKLSGDKLTTSQARAVLVGFCIVFIAIAIYIVASAGPDQPRVPAYHGGSSPQQKR